MICSNQGIVLYMNKGHVAIVVVVAVVVALVYVSANGYAAAK